MIDSCKLHKSMLKYINKILMRIRVILWSESISLQTTYNIKGKNNNFTGEEN